MKYQWGGGKRTYYINTLHKDFPKYRVTGISRQDGYIYGTILQSIPLWETRHAFKMNNSGDIVFYYLSKHGEFSEYLQDFQPVVLNNKIFYKYIRRLTANGYNISTDVTLLDDKYNEVSKLNINNSFIVDDHETIFFDSNHFLYATYHPDYIDNKLVYAVRILEHKDGQTTELFNSLDYPEFIEMSIKKDNIKPTNTPTDYLHLNSMQLVVDNSILMSMPAANAIIKYNYKDKKIEWILGGKLDQFGLSKEQQFYFQHFARLDGDELTLFDNHIKDWVVKGDGYARALEFKIDEKNKKITSFKEYKNELHKNINFCGSFQKNVIGNDVFYNIGWGCFGRDHQSSYYSEIDIKNNKIDFEIYFDEKHFGGYRILRYPY